MNANQNPKTPKAEGIERGATQDAGPRCGETNKSLTCERCGKPIADGQHHWFDGRCYCRDCKIDAVQPILGIARERIDEMLWK